MQHFEDKCADPIGITCFPLEIGTGWQGAASGREDSTRVSITEKLFCHSLPFFLFMKGFICAARGVRCQRQSWIPAEPHPKGAGA